MSFESFEEDKDPLIWVLIDEAHELLPKEGKTPATDALVQLLREGRQPGISLVLATQQPGEIHKDVLTQSDIVISHRLTSKIDVEALNNMMQTYLLADIQKYMNELPDLKGSAIVLDDNSERIYPIRVHPKKSWHGGETPSILKDKEKLFKEL
jgi:DNA segregation ATPase FtsK/SpoIIIE-like protein